MAEFKPSCEPVAWIDAADFEVLESDRWCVVHTDCCDPGADHNASEPLYTAAQFAAEVAKAVEAERERWLNGIEHWAKASAMLGNAERAQELRDLAATMSAGGAG